MRPPQSSAPTELYSPPVHRSRGSTTGFPPPKPSSWSLGALTYSDLATAVYTSGTTGRPRGMELPPTCQSPGGVTTTCHLLVQQLRGLGPVSSSPKRVPKRVAMGGSTRRAPAPAVDSDAERLSSSPVKARTSSRPLRHGHRYEACAKTHKLPGLN